LLLVPYSSRSQEAAALLSAVQAKLNKVKDYVAEGVMKTNVTFLKVPVSKVKVYYKQPDKVKIKSEKGVSFVPRGAVALNMAGLLQEGKFDVIDGGNTVISGKKLNIVKLVPVEDDNPVILSVLHIDPANQVVIKAKTTTKENGTYEMEFTYGKYMALALPDKIQFSFDARDYKLPKGITFDFDDGKGSKKPPSISGKQKGTALITLNKYAVNAGIPTGIFK
jgi:hypothetical protein